MLKFIGSYKEKKKRIDNNKGFTLLETLLAIGLGALMIASAAYALSQRANDIRDKAMAEHLQIAQDAAGTFAKNNYVDLKDNAPQRFTMASINEYLPPNFSTSPYGHTYELVTRPIIRAGVREGFEMLLVAGNPTREIEPKRVPAISGLAGAKTGYIRTNPLGGGEQIIGAFGGWQRNLSDFTMVSVADPQFAVSIMLNDTSVTADYLYRNEIPGQPQLNRMNTDIDMNNNDINNVANLNADNITSNTGTITNLNSDVIDVGTVNADTVNTNFLYSSEIESKKSIRACTDNDNGCGIEISSEGKFVDNNDGWITYEGADKGLKISGTGNDLHVDNDIYLGIRQQWLSELTPNYVLKNVYLVQHGWNVVKPTCATGDPSDPADDGIPRIVVVPQIGGVDQPMIAFQYRAIDQGLTWGVVSQAFGQYGTIGTTRTIALAMTYCLYKT